MVTLKTQRLILHPVKISDAEAIYNLTRDEEILKYTQVPRDYSIKKAREHITKENKKVKQGKALHLAITLKENKKINKQMIGIISLNSINKQHKRAAIGYWLGKQYRNKGYIKEACKVLLSFCFNQLKLNRIQFSCSTENKASQKVIESLNAVFEGIQRQKTYKDCRFHDKRVYAILKEEYSR
ncbi:GNAT family N-acetyltransferase [Candidatus Woesearchaeota archaeon]|nr:GNAT family N-acetyltransferase [Candidatus Woesearchaeota archaeon]